MICLRCRSQLKCFNLNFKGPRTTSAIVPWQTSLRVCLVAARCHCACVLNLPQPRQHDWHQSLHWRQHKARTSKQAHIPNIGPVQSAIPAVKGLSRCLLALSTARATSLTYRATGRLPGCPRWSRSSTPHLITMRREVCSLVPSPMSALLLTNSCHCVYTRSAVRAGLWGVRQSFQARASHGIREVCQAVLGAGGAEASLRVPKFCRCLPPQGAAANQLEALLVILIHLRHRACRPAA